MKYFFLSLFIVSLSLVGCKDDDEPTGEASNFTVTIENVVTPFTYFQSGVVNTPVGGTMPGPIFPGDSYEITFNAGPNVTPMDGGARLSFVTMFVQSNDLFLAPDEAGIALFDGDGNPIGEGTPANVTDQVELWDAGTEVNEETGGPNQKPQQDATSGMMNATDIGLDETGGVVTLIENNTDGTNTLPDVDEVISVTITHNGGNEFTAVFTNVSDAMTIARPAIGPNERAAVPMSPFAWAVHTGDAPFFTAGEAASTAVEDIAEDGEAGEAATLLTENTGVIVPLSPGAWAVHDDDEKPLYTLGEDDRGEGLEGIAEDGTPGDLGTALDGKDDVSASGVFNTPVGASAPSAIGPGGSYSFTFEARPGERLSLATMFVQSNDWFYSFSEDGLDLFTGTTPVTGDVSSSIFLYDAGTEVDQYPGAGADQVIRQSAANSGADDSDSNVRVVTSTFDNVPADASSVIKVTITAQ